MKVLIADDEKRIRIGLSKSIDWKNLGIQNILLAEDGLSALTLCEKEHPEIVITDIRMPGLNGLDLAKAASEKYSAKKVIILSGYSEFEYAQKAIRIGVEEYLLKPVKIEELSALLSKSVEQIKLQMQTADESRQKKILASLESNLEKPLSLEEIKGLVYPERMKIPSEVSIVIINRDVIYGGNRKDVTIEWAKILDDHETLLWEIEDGVVFLEEIETREDREQYHSKLRNWFREKNLLNVEKEYSMGVSERGFVKDIKALYPQAVDALKHRMYLGPGMCLFYEQVPLVAECVHPYLHLNKAAIKECVEIIQTDLLKKQIELHFIYLKQKKCVDVNTVSELCVAIKNVVFEVMKEKGVDIEGILSRNQELFQKQLEFTSIESYEAWISDYCFLLLHGFRDICGKKYSTIISKTVDYINQHYMEDITLILIADEVKKSTSYFCSVFKKEMGVNFNEYLNQVRIRRAKELLKEPDVVIYEVAEKTGFHDYKYFTKVFKKICGCSPSEYIKN